MASTTLEDQDDELVDDEIWENQRREGSSGMWLPSWDRGRFSDRFGRFKYNQLGDVPVPRNSRVVEDFAVASGWTYAKNFATLESDLAKGVHRNVKWNYSVRWRRWSRKRCSVKETSHEIMSGWLGSKERRGTWKSRYFMLIGGGSTVTPGGAGGGEETDDDSSNDEGDDDDVEQGGGAGGGGDVQHAHHPNLDDLETSMGSPRVMSSPMPLMGKESASKSFSLPDPSPPQPSPPPPILFYLRRGFTDPRAAFPLTFDLSEVRNFPKKQIRTVKLSARVRIDDTLYTSENPGRFAIRFPSGGKRVLNAACGELRERWVDALRSLIEDSAQDSTSSPTQKRHGRLAAAFRAAKRGQKELRKGFGTLRRSSHQGTNSSTHSMISSMPHSLPSPSLFAHHTSQQANSLPPDSSEFSLFTPITNNNTYHHHTVDLLRAELSGALNIRLTECVPGRGLYVDAVLEGAREASIGQAPTSLSVGDNIVAVQGESLIGLDKGMCLVKLKEILTRSPNVVTLSVASAQTSSVTKKSPAHASSNGQHSPSSSTSPVAMMMLHRRMSAESVGDGGGTKTLSSSSSQFGLEVGGDDSEREENGESFKTAATPGYMEKKTSTSSSLFSSHTDSGGVNTPLQQHAVSASSSTSSSWMFNPPPIQSLPISALGSPVTPPIVRMHARVKVVEVPANGLGIVSSHARSVTLKCLEKMLASGNSVTYAQLRQDVADTLHAESAFDTDEWRLWFRDFLDYWVCDGNKYMTGGLDLSDFTPVILKCGAGFGGGASTEELVS